MRLYIVIIKVSAVVEDFFDQHRDEGSIPYPDMFIWIV